MNEYRYTDSNGRFILERLNNRISYTMTVDSDGQSFGTTQYCPHIRVEGQTLVALPCPPWSISVPPCKTSTIALVSYWRPCVTYLRRKTGTMDFDQLTTFVQVAKLGSFSRAGQKVFRSQSAVSAQIRQLEQAYGARLLDRTAKSVHLTPAGEVLFEYAERLLRLRDESVQAVADRSDRVQGPVVFGANEATCLYLLPDIFAEFQRRYPSVQISIYRNFSHKILQRLEDGSIDVGIVTLPVKSPNLRVHPVFRDRLMVMVHPKNPLAGRSRVPLAQVAEQPLIFPKTGYTRQVLDKLFRPYRSRIHVTMELPSVGMIKRFVAANAGVSFISERFARDYVKAGEVKLLSLDGVDLWRELGLVYRRDRSLPRAAQALISLIREHRKTASAPADGSSD